jgi:ArsR family transcriptional regulator
VIAEAAAPVYRALGDPNRIKIVNQLAASDEPVCVCTFVDALGVSQPTVSHHLRTLWEAGIVEREQRGRWAYYSLNRELLDGLL